MSLEDLYRDVILDHYRNPRHREPLTDPDATAEGVNPLCGDEVKVELAFDGDRLTDISVRGQGCSISQSSASMMSEAVMGKTRDEVVEIARRFNAMMTADDETAAGLDPSRPGSVLGDLEALQGVRQYPVRIKCASLPWTTLEQALG
ncbi:MAG TPA: SUF system NifU family Fe-S cluster assembly protein [Acidimicrobiia bacterium]|jgi:nitrogen fixation NifU-like protein|nr:SUF system NifU family Fe-S cluster assembly protein [Acidimicrobiia bacterium]